ncbi:MAG: LuxR family transcriptional regulator [Pseudomonadota bacterium]
MTEAAFRRFAAEADAAEAPPALWAAARRWLRAEGVARMSYHHHLGGSSSPDGGIFAEGFPDAWIDAYRAEELHRVDPIPRLALRSMEPFHWDDASRLTETSQAELAYLDRLEKAALGDGLAVQVFGPEGRNGYCGLGFGGERRELTRERVRLLQAGCQIAHLRYCRLVPADAGDRSGLTAREREVLHWLAQGKSNGVIADILGCSPHTVDTHTRRIFRKLGVADRISAAVQAVGRGLVTS